MKRQSLPFIRVVPMPSDRRRGRVLGPGLDLPCALGRSGVASGKREGDGATPRSRLRAIAAWYRPDRMPRPATRLPVRAITPASGWCDDPSDRFYNRPVRLPYRPSHERMWREDALYDLVFDLSWNRGPIRAGRGSAIFLHSARPGFPPTEGCVAVDRSAIRRLLARVGPGTVIAVGPGVSRPRR